MVEKNKVLYDCSRDHHIGYDEKSIYHTVLSKVKNSDKKLFKKKETPGNGKPGSHVTVKKKSWFKV